MVYILLRPKWYVEHGTRKLTFMFLVFKGLNKNANVYVKAIQYLYSRFEISIGYAKTIFLNDVVYSCYRMKFNMHFKNRNICKVTIVHHQNVSNCK